MRRLRALHPHTCLVTMLLSVLVLAMASFGMNDAFAIDRGRLLDEFEDLTVWSANASDGVKASAESSSSVDGRAMRLNFDFGGVAGYAFARRKLPLDLPENYELSFYLRADAAVNNFEVKLADASGDNVWWFERRDFEFPSAWRLIKIKKRQIAFAWGPTLDHSLRHSDSVEFVIAAGRGGGKGSVEVAGLRLRELPPDPARFPPLTATASSTLAGAEAALAVDGDASTAWRSDPQAGTAQTLTVDLGMMREFGGLELRWQNRARASRYDIAASDDGVAWRILRRVANAAGEKDAILLPEEEARYIRLDLHEGPKDGYALAELTVKDVAFGASPNAFFEALAKEAPRGHYPRGFSGEQPYWTLVGVDGGSESGLLSEDGALEVARGGFSIEPFILSDTRLITWADVETSHSLSGGYLPIPSVTWHHHRWSMCVTAFAQGARDRADLVSSYTVSNLTDEPQSLQLVLAVRPFQVNPPTQFLNFPGGVSPIRSLEWDGVRLWVNGRAKVIPLGVPDRFAASPFESGAYPDAVLASDKVHASRVHDDTGFASGALVYQLDLAPRASATVGLVAPLSREPAQPDLGGKSIRDWLDQQRTAVETDWRAKLNLVDFDVPARAQRQIDTLRSSLAQILMTRDGPILRPGTRSYGRSWIRDGAMISESLLRLGHDDIAADYLRWFAPHQFESGRVPCCVDARGADPIPENDSNGQLIFLAAEVFRYTGDRSLLETVWRRIEAAARYMDQLRTSERGPRNLTPKRRMLFGLFPPSISHEGYASKPAYSYWDVFWGLRGYKDAVAIASALGKREIANQFAQQLAEFRRDVHASFRSSARVHGIGYVPGAADLGDFDATSTTIAFAPSGEEDIVPADLLRETFERYWRNFEERRDGLATWEDYTPYELRVVAHLRTARLARARTRAPRFFPQGPRPAGWNQWAEVVGREPRQPQFIGDMPHAWVASDYIRSVLDMFVYERQTDGALVLAKGIPNDWVNPSGFSVTNLRTPYGQINLSFRPEGSEIVIEISGDAHPPGGFILPAPWAHYANVGSSDDRSSVRNGELHIVRLPIKIRVLRTDQG